MQQKAAALLAMLVTVVVQSSPALSDDTSLNEVEIAANEFLQEYDLNYGILLNEKTKGQWNYETNLTDHNNQVYLNASAKVDKPISFLLIKTISIQ